MSDEAEPQEFDAHSLTVDERGQVVARTVHRARVWVQPLGAAPMELVLLPGGTFTMGSDRGEGYEDERPRHSVTVAPFPLGRYPVTQAQWEALMGSLPRVRGRGSRRPVDRISWYDARQFCARLSERTGRPYRLPSEAEWEYACRAGTVTPFHFGPTITTDLANYVGEHTYRLEPQGVYRHDSTDVGSFSGNPFGLHDMHGNVWEWCEDAWHDDYVGAPADGSPWEAGEATYRVMRGGSWHDPPGLCRCATRLRQRATDSEDLFGFRVALSTLILEDRPAARAPGRPRSPWARFTALIGRRDRGERQEGP